MPLSFFPTSRPVFILPTPAPPPWTTSPPPPTQVPVPAVLQRRPDASGELGLQHGGPPAARPPPGQHHAARQPAAPAVGADAPTFLQQPTPGGAGGLLQRARTRRKTEIQLCELSTCCFVCFVFFRTPNRGDGERASRSPSALFALLTFLSSRRRRCHPSPPSPPRAPI